MGKVIVFCADGTWNKPGPDQPGEDAAVIPTNVFGFYHLLAPNGHEAPSLEPEQEKSLSEGGGVVQVAKYLHGVGASDNWLVHMLGGAVGTGTVSRIVRGYTFISRHYQPGDRIVLLGFSRGAYTVRALAGLIAARGLLPAGMPAGDPAAYSLGLRVWHAYRAETAPAQGERACAVMAGLLANILEPPMPELVPVERIDAVAVWDTVGALGIPQYDNDGGRKDTFQFANTALSRKVRLGLHAVSIDDLRADFTPTLWDPDGNRIMQVLFPGAHADVGGGYAPDHAQPSGEWGRLSDAALLWMVDELEHAGLGLRFGDPTAVDIHPSALAMAHDERVNPPYNLRPPKRRELPPDRLVLSQCAEKRLCRVVKTFPTIPDGEVYMPPNLAAFVTGGSANPGIVRPLPSQMLV